MEAQVRHGIAPHGFWQVVRQSEEASHQHEDALDPSSGDDAHQEIGHHTCNGHHEALDHAQAGQQAQDEVGKMGEARVQVHQEVAYGTRNQRYQAEKGQRRQEIGQHEGDDPIVPVQMLSAKHLHVFHK